jgi:hypothetical protein
MLTKFVSNISELDTMVTINLKLDRFRITIPKGGHIFPKVLRLHL